MSTVEILLDAPESISEDNEAYPIRQIYEFSYKR